MRSLITQEAADWFVANRAGLSASQHDTFAAWLRTSPVHVEEYLSLSVIAGNLREACVDSAHSIDTLLARARVEPETPLRRLWPRLLAVPRDALASRWRGAAVTMAAFGVASLGLLLWWNLKTVAPVQPAAGITALHFATQHGEQQTHRLADGSVLHLNTDSAVTVRYSGTERRVTLTSGEADFEVVHEPGHPFRVFAGPAEVVDLGTKFDVRLADSAALVTVVEGRVAVGRAAQPASGGETPGHAPQFVQLGADQQITVTEGAWPATPVGVDAQRTTAWLRRLIVFENEPLEHVVSELNRYAAKPIEIATPGLRELEISGIFTTDNSAAFIAFLRSLEGVQVDDSGKRVLVSQK